MSESPACPACASGSSIEIGGSRLDEAKLERFARAVPLGAWLREARARHGELEQTVHACAACGLLFLHPVLSDEETLSVGCAAESIPLEFSPGWEPLEISRPASVWSQAVRIPSLNRLLRPFLARPLRVLDVGASGGELSLGLDLAAGSSVDLLQTTRGYAAGVPRQGISIRQASALVSHIASGDYRCDLLLALHVLEHTGDPYRFLLDCCGLLREEGLMVIEVPYEFEAAYAVATGETFQIPHNVFFAPWSLRRLLARLPLAVENFELLDHFHTGVGDVHYPVLRALCRKKTSPPPDWRDDAFDPFVQTVDKLFGNLSGSLAYRGGARFKIFFYPTQCARLANLLRPAPGFRGLTSSNAELISSGVENVFSADWRDIDFLFTFNAADRAAARENVPLPPGCSPQ